MPEQSKSGGHATDMLFVLALLGMFLVGSALVIVVGARAYTGALERMDSAAQSRMALGYIAGKIRQNDTEGSISIGDIDGTPALCLKSEYDGIIYTTYIYHWQGELRELFLGPDSVAGPDAGQALVPVGGLGFKRLSGGLYRLSCTDDKGRESSLMIAPRSSGVPA